MLVVDDEASTRRLFRKLLERDGFRVHEACDGVEALVKAADIRPGVILMDIEMPNMDGLECTRAFKAEPTLCDIPVIVVSERRTSDTCVPAWQQARKSTSTSPSSPTNS